MMVPASSWFCRRELINEVGPWRSYRECYSVPSQDWIYRAWKAGKDLRLVPQMTVVAILSGTRVGVYENRDVWENRLYFDRIQFEPDFRSKELTSIATNYETPWLRWYSASQLLLRALRNLLARIVVAAGMDPINVRNFFVYKRKGGLIDLLRQRRGLQPLSRKAKSDHRRKSIHEDIGK
jgi:GT2 family glycosyltransferase